MAQKALQTDAYLCFDELDRDVRMMCNNCVRYNGSMNEVITSTNTILRYHSDTIIYTIIYTPYGTFSTNPLTYLLTCLLTNPLTYALTPSHIPSHTPSNISYHIPSYTILTFPRYSTASLRPNIWKIGYQYVIRWPDGSLSVCRIVPGLI